MLRTSALLALVIASPALADSPFDGTWKGNPASATLDVKPDEFGIVGGTYSCMTCLPPFSVKADGAFHPVKDKPYWDELAVRVVDDHGVAYQYRKGGKVVAETTQTVSPDGRTLLNVSSNTNNAAGTKIDYRSTQLRVGAPVAGAHLISGAWKVDPGASQVSDSGVTLTLKVDGGMLHLTSPLGETLDARIGGAYAPNVGDPGKTMTKVAMPAPNRLVMTDMRGGKVVQIATYTVAADGRTMTSEWHDPRDGSKGTFKIAKQ